MVACEIDLVEFSIRCAALGKNLDAGISSRSDVLCISPKDDSGLVSSMTLLIAFNIDWVCLHRIANGHLWSSSTGKPNNFSASRRVNGPQLWISYCRMVHCAASSQSVIHHTLNSTCLSRIGWILGWQNDSTFWVFSSYIVDKLIAFLSHIRGTLPQNVVSQI